MISEAQQNVISKYTAEAPVKLGSLAKELGLEVFKSTLRPEISGLIEPSETALSGFRIRLNRYEPVERQRFTLAHEIAHFLLHKQDIRSGVVDDVMYRSALSNRKEVEANKYASDLVMPGKIVSEYRRNLTYLPTEDLVSELARIFRVSPAAMRIKLGV